MQDLSFYIDNTGNQEVIRASELPVAVTVSRLRHDKIDDKEEYLTFYGDNDGEYFAFTTADNPDILPATIHALAWYASALNFPCMIYSLNDPRPTGLRLVR